MKKLLILALSLIFLLVSTGCETDIQDNSNDETGSYVFIVMGVGESNISLAEIGKDGRGIKSKQYIVPNWFYPSTEIKKGDKITVKHNGFILESSPMQFGEIYSMEHRDKKTGLSTVVIAD